MIHAERTCQGQLLYVHSLNYIQIPMMKYAINEVIEENKLLSMVFSLEISKCGNVMGVYVGKAPPPK